MIIMIMIMIIILIIFWKQMRNSCCKGKKNRLQPQTMTKSNASFNAREWAVELLIPSSRRDYVAEKTIRGP
jgi:hypothetical protein